MRPRNAHLLRLWPRNLDGPLQVFLSRSCRSCRRGKGTTGTRSASPLRTHGSDGAQPHSYSAPPMAIFGPRFGSGLSADPVSSGSGLIDTLFSDSLSGAPWIDFTLLLFFRSQFVTASITHGSLLLRLAGKPLGKLEVPRKRDLTFLRAEPSAACRPCGPCGPRRRRFISTSPPFILQAREGVRRGSGIGKAGTSQRLLKARLAANMGFISVADSRHRR